VVLKYLGQLLFVLALLAVIPLAVSIISGDYGAAVRLGAVIAVLGTAGYACGRIDAPRRIQANEALAITGVAFVVGSFAMSFPLGASGLTFIDALFESVSAMTTTGLSVTDTVETKSAAFLFSRAWMQWVGGLGIVVLSVALPITPGQTARRLGYSEIESSDLAGGIRANARGITRTYLVLTFAGFAVLLASGMSAFDAVVHTLAGISTGGFSNYDKSIGGLGGFTAQAAVTFVSTLGAVSLGLYPRMFGKGWREALSNLELRGLVLLGTSFSLLFGLSLWVADGCSIQEAVRTAPIMAFSAQSTTGFSAMDISSMGGVSKFVLMMAMSIGGSMGSTAGGMKILRFIIVMRVAWFMVQRTATPAGTVSVFRIGGRVAEYEELQDSLIIVLLFIGVCLVSWMFFLAYGYDPLDSLFEVVSATGTVGLSSGVAGPTLPDTLKYLLCMDMIMGRVEFVALLVVLYPGTWFGKKGENK
jgi:trk system potassium uptake protein TrkH